MHAPNQIQNSEDILLWADGTWCFRHELHWMTHMSDDYQTLAFDTSAWSELIASVEAD